MEIINGVETIGGAYIEDPAIVYDSETFTDDHTVTLDEVGKTLIMNSSSNKTFTLPSVGTANVGVWFKFVNINTGRLTIDAADSDTIDDSSAGATIYSDDDSISSLTIELASATQWIITGANGTWTTS